MTGRCDIEQVRQRPTAMVGHSDDDPDGESRAIGSSISLAATIGRDRHAPEEHVWKLKAGFLCENSDTDSIFSIVATLFFTLGNICSMFRHVNFTYSASSRIPVMTLAVAITAVFALPGLGCALAADAGRGEYYTDKNFKDPDLALGDRLNDLQSEQSYALLVEIGDVKNKQSLEDNADKIAAFLLEREHFNFVARLKFDQATPQNISDLIGKNGKFRTDWGMEKNPKSGRFLFIMLSGFSDRETMDEWVKEGGKHDNIRDLVHDWTAEVADLQHTLFIVDACFGRDQDQLPSPVDGRVPDRIKEMGHHVTSPGTQDQPTRCHGSDMDTNLQIFTAAFIYAALGHTESCVLRAKEKRDRENRNSKILDLSAPKIDLDSEHFQSLAQYVSEVGATIYLNEDDTQPKRLPGLASPVYRDPDQPYFGQFFFITRKGDDNRPPRLGLPVGWPEPNFSKHRNMVRCFGTPVNVDVGALPQAATRF